MKRLRLPAALALAPLVLALAVPAAAPARSPADRMVDTINFLRGHAGLRSFKRSPALRRSAAARARRMMRRNFFAHPARLHVRGFARVGEVLAMHRGHRPRVRRTIRRWGRSPGHRSVLGARTYGRIGAARASGRFRGRRVTIWVVRVGRR